MAKIDPNEPCPCGSGNPFKACHGPKVRTTKDVAITERVRLTVIPEPDHLTRAVFVRTGEGTIAFSGYESGVAQCCGTCDSELIVGLPVGRVENVVIRCNKCGSFNDTVRHGSA